MDGADPSFINLREAEAEREQPVLLTFMPETGNAVYRRGGRPKRLGRAARFICPSTPALPCHPCLHLCRSSSRRVTLGYTLR